MTSLYIHLFFNLLNNLISGVICGETYKKVEVFLITLNPLLQVGMCAQQRPTLKVFVQHALRQMGKFGFSYICLIVGKS